ncbi:23S rRNA (cytidine1920-2'-O)/16S rRNA (cytidine1409-2'-O)-methyltransferase [Alicyclobacillus sacchari]|uniref:23S rRNA (Cytidine1920-2'-O)/16S rRNA (Cytidine1409-2'-O)-methyltransferase n=1 Tax=Alicyclobacillus sacchari TaxID=392010 RepID=A0A4R8LJ05_9BACL|nr:TlyA family RNA methyltransferase [Alicyclobacillus sacchari]TDY43412.1 23S rRNA (cytidine1920-2'-O)/16S rRNA (cytidine1409-2'-O)-methyltransferase [Alicyclobacillus sacchari]GMA55835.1 putative rRNA methyltransferase YqxC [Alicyclobacillus sacchari]
MAKVRLDVFLHERGDFPSREAARRAVMAGLVDVDGVRVEKPGTQINPERQVTVKRPPHQFVSRGGLKLERALTMFGVPVADRVAIDVGASTGGFTDCLLQHGARLVYAVDVGYGQLAWSLRQDERVRVMERFNFRHADPKWFDPTPELAVMDVSFISTKLLFPKLAEVCHPASDIVSLIKPQFEAGRGKVGKGGIVRDKQVHLDVLLDMLDHVTTLGWSCWGLDYSPISGGDGNIEFLAWWRMFGSPEQTAVWRSRCSDVVQSAWQAVGGNGKEPG